MEKERVLLGMSGGVDSAAAAALLARRGYQPVGCTLSLVSSADIGQEGSCCSLEDVEDARSVAARLGMDHFVFNFKDLFRTQVMEDFVAEYRRGRTPNPCVRCNRYVKFPALLRRADDLGIAHVATGHYARVDWDGASGRWRLLRGADRRKDQSYFLYPLTQEQLSRLLLPVGDYTKDQIRALAEELGLVNARKRDSQDICFVPGGDYMEFLTRFGGVEPRPGDFVDASGKVLGRHRGLERYTAGQRRGLGVSADRPLYVTGKDLAANTVVLGDEADLYSSVVWTESFNWVSLPPQAGPVAVTAKTRYSQREAEAALYPEADGRARLEFVQPQRAVAPGQSLVAYLGETVVGGGVICRAE